MHTNIVAALVGAAVLGVPAPAGAWGLDAHRFIMERAIDLLPPAIRPFFEADRAFVVEHTIDPDLWRVAGFADENSRHQIDLDAYGKYPFDALPREYGAAIEKYGLDTLQRNGVLPWRVAEVDGWLARAFEQVPGNVGYARDNVKFYAAVLAHYIADGHVPFHVARNYNGQLTGQVGIHSRWETELFARYRAQLTVRPAPARHIPNVRDFMFETALSGFQFVQGILDADRRAIGTGDVYDDRYFDAFFAATRPVLEARLSESISAVASAITTAWEQAGRPELPVNPPATPPRKRAR